MRKSLSLGTGSCGKEEGRMCPRSELRKGLSPDQERGPSELEAAAALEELVFSCLEPAVVWAADQVLTFPSVSSAQVSAAAAESTSAVAVAA